jgi:hypothetical protein
MQWIAHYFEGVDERGRRWIVRPCVGTAAAVVQAYGLEELIHWQAAWGTYRPNATSTADRLVAEFLRIVSRRRKGDPDRVNAELAMLAREGPPGRCLAAAASRSATYDGHERQLPVGDRA